MIWPNSAARFCQNGQYLLNPCIEHRNEANDIYRSNLGVGLNTIWIMSYYFLVMGLSLNGCNFCAELGDFITCVHLDSYASAECGI